MYDMSRCGDRPFDRQQRISLKVERLIAGRSVGLYDAGNPQTWGKFMIARIAFHISLVSALVTCLCSAPIEAQEPNPRIRRMGTQITLRQDATNEDLEQLKDEKGITSLTSSGRIEGAGGPFITDAGLAHIAGWTELRVLRLHGLNIGDAGLANLARLPNLEIIDLGIRKSRMPALLTSGN